MPYQQLQIRDIFIGSVDAKDDFNIDKQEFISNFYKPDAYDIDSFLYGNNYFIEGLKGIGKTALLYYMKSMLDNEGKNSEIILFKSHFDDYRKVIIEQQMDNYIKIDKSSDIEIKNFTYFWKIILISKILQMNADANHSIYQDSKDLELITKLIQTVLKQSKKGLLRKIMESFKGAKITNYYNDVVTTLGFDFDFESIDTKTDIIETIEAIMTLFAKINQTGNSNTAYIFIDELEAYLSDERVFKRDLALIRDLIFTVKEINALTFNSTSKNFKLICAVRSEILDSIDKNIPSKELNKAIFGYKQILKWNFNVKGTQHPLFQIWIKRIKSAEYKFNKTEYSDQEILEKWFIKHMYGDNIVEYIIHNTWIKPRDIIRFMKSASNVDGKRLSYDQFIFENLRKEYSRESWKELSEELNAQYTKKEISIIKKFLTGMISVFTYKQAIERANNISKSTDSSFLIENLDEIMQILFRIGALGNISLDKMRHRWAYKGDEHVLLSDPNFLIEIHYALYNELSIIKIQRNSISHIEINKKFKCTIEKSYAQYIQVQIDELGIFQSIRISDMHLDASYRDLRTSYQKGSTVFAKVYFDASKNQKKLERISEEEFLKKDSFEDKLNELYEKFRRH